MTRKKTTSPIKLFIGAFAMITAVMVIFTMTSEKVVLLDVPGNAGVSILETVDDSLVCTFQDGRIVSWQWGTIPEIGADFKVASDRVVILDANRIAAVSSVDKKVLTVHSLPDGHRQKDITVGWEDQDLWLRISPDKKTVALIRRNTVNTKKKILYEFLTIDVEKNLTGAPVPVSIQQGVEDLVDYTVDNNSIVYAAGSKEETGRIAAVNLEQGSVLWDAVFDNSKEFCSIAVSADNSVLYAGNRDGVLYKINADTGEMVKKIKLLEDGETRPITNDYSVLNLAFSPDGQYFAATIHPKVYILKTDSDGIFHTCSPADRLVSKVAFSPDSMFFATSDIRAGYPIKIWPMPKEN